MSDTDFDTRFDLPAVDDSASTEVGVILLGLDAERLLAGLGMASLADDLGRVTTLVDQLRHDLGARLTIEAAVAAGAHRWRSVRAALAEADPHPTTSAAVRQAWTKTYALVAGADIGDTGPATRVYLTACRLRRADVDRQVESAP
ncbi:DUF6187 family protein [Actinokineospora sp.]|uniref:DUF6187 family protein n=1 Tax=Actinokineospora sp. TaxID=1872133 RepID=UPI004037B5B7